MAVRTCVSCGKKTEKFNLIRYTWSGDGPVEDVAGIAPGRGAYTCRDEKCTARFAVQQKKWKRLFRL